MTVGWTHPTLPTCWKEKRWKELIKLDVGLISRYLPGTQIKSSLELKSIIRFEHSSCGNIKRDYSTIRVRRSTIATQKNLKKNSIELKSNLNLRKSTFNKRNIELPQTSLRRLQSTSSAAKNPFTFEADQFHFAVSFSLNFNVTNYNEIIKYL